MRHTLMFGAAALAAVLSSATMASAQAIQMTATLTAGEETPALLSGAVGTAEVSVDTASNEVAVTLRVFNIPTTTAAGHIHIGPRGVAGPVVLDFPAIAGRLGDFATTFRLNSGSFRPNAAIGINTLEDAVQAIANGNAYVNIHTAANPAGEIRGQITLLR